MLKEKLSLLLEIVLSAMSTTAIDVIRLMYVLHASLIIHYWKDNVLDVDYSIVWLVIASSFVVNARRAMQLVLRVNA